MKKVILFISLLLIFGSAQTYAAGDWKKCKTKMAISNTKDKPMLYRLFWLDHDVKEHQGRPAERAGGGIQPNTLEGTSKEFRLCPGRHIMFWSTNDIMTSKKYKVYMFVITSEMKYVIITPDIVFSDEAEVPFQLLYPKK